MQFPLQCVNMKLKGSFGTFKSFKDRMSHLFQVVNALTLLLMKWALWKNGHKLMFSALKRGDKKSQLLWDSVDWEDLVHLLAE